MNRFLTEVLPKGLVEAQARRGKLESKSWDLGRRLEMDEEFAGHSCDCDRCESNDVEWKELSALEREEMQQELDDVVAEINQLNTDIRRMTDYKSFMEARR